MHRNLVSRAKRALERLQSNIEQDAQTGPVTSIILTDLADDDDQDDTNSISSSPVAPTHTTTHHSQHKFHPPAPLVSSSKIKTRYGNMQHQSNKYSKPSKVCKAETQGWAFRTAETTTTHATGGIVTADLPMALGYRDFPNNNDTNNTNNHVQQKAALQPQRPIEEIPQIVVPADLLADTQTCTTSTPSLLLDPSVVLYECRSHVSGSSLPIAKKIAGLEPIEAARVLQAIFDEARQTKALFDDIQQLAIATDIRKAALQCCSTACTHLKAQNAAVVSTPSVLLAPPTLVNETQPDINSISPTFIQQSNNTFAIYIPITTTKYTRTTTTATIQEQSGIILPPSSSPLSSSPLPPSSSSLSPSSPSFSIVLQWSENDPLPDLKKIEHVCAAAAIVGQLYKPPGRHRRVPTFVAGAKLTKYQRESELLSTKAQMIACIDEKSLFHVVNVHGAKLFDVDTCHLFLRDDPSPRSGPSGTATSRRRSKLIQLRTFAKTGGQKYEVPGIPRAPEFLESIRMDSKNNWWVQDGEIVCHLEKTEITSNQKFPSVERIHGGLPIAAVKQGNLNVVCVADSMNMDQYLTTDPAWGLSPRLAAVLDGDLAAKRMSVMAVPLKDNQGVVRFARYAITTTGTGATTTTTKHSLQKFDAIDTVPAQMFAGVVAEILPLTLVAQQSKDSAIAAMYEAKTALAAVGSTRLRHNLMIDGFVSISKASTIMAVCSQVGYVCLSFINKVFRQDVPFGATASSTVFTVIQEDSGSNMREVTDIKHNITRSMLGVRNHTWLHQTAEQCSRLQKPVFYSSSDSRSFPATACFPLSSTARTAHVVCLYVAYTGLNNADDSNDDDDNDADDLHVEMDIIVSGGTTKKKKTNNKSNKKNKNKNKTKTSFQTSNNSTSTSISPTRLTGYNFNRKEELNNFFDQIISFGTDVIKMKQQNDNLLSKLVAFEYERSSKLKKMTKSMNALSKHTREYFQGSFEFQPGIRVHLQTLCEMVAVAMKADHIQLYVAHQDLEPEIALTYQTPKLDLLHIRIPRKKHFVMATQLLEKKNTKEQIEETQPDAAELPPIASAEYLAPGAILAASPIPLLYNGMTDFDSPRMWILAERFSGGEFPTYDYDDCEQLVNLTELVFHELSNILILDAARVTCLHARCALDVAQHVSGGINDSKIPLRSMLLSLHGNHMDSASFLAVGKENPLPWGAISQEEKEEKEETIEMEEIEETIETKVMEETKEIEEIKETKEIEATKEIKEIEEMATAQDNNEKILKMIAVGETVIEETAKEDEIDQEYIEISDEDVQNDNNKKETKDAIISINSDLWLTSVCDTQPTSSKAYPLDGSLSELEELAFLKQAITDLNRMANQKNWYVHRRTIPIDQIFDHRTRMEQWFKDYVETIQISPIFVRESKLYKDVTLIGFVMLVDGKKENNKMKNATKRNSTGDIMAKKWQNYSRTMIEMIVQQSINRKCLWNYAE